MFSVYRTFAAFLHGYLTGVTCIVSITLLR